MAAAPVCPWDVNVDQGFIHPIDIRDLPAGEREKYLKDQRRKQKHIKKEEVIDDLTYYAPEEQQCYDNRDAPSAFSTLFGSGKSSGSSQKSDDSKKSSKSVFSKFRKAKRRDKEGEWKKIQ